ncbi:hypothetical protein BJD20_15070 [Acinetobacter proteolyticus]|jgi:hypothetical protein|uniref:Lipoprotein n=1 Tax=Acinetobacter proteolyticus TaxID=1776741 RepID=A0A653KAS3_9GAMM|nr:hypothetical protein [Acinetobacter proteolyticus]OJU83345.1 MAG: hypothetical protein BGN93_18175 [Acinetobacter sp. 39-4]QHH94917.1 hypothetical protein FPL18_14330 [Acinetobacter gyllenbergii]OEY95407.1 hypothetical protein BJD20_15070 [Acinetobacter proteolyticus]PKF32329.1 hypothetical protein CW311_13960 [Acinetobacter proteolyticus]WEI18311.1 hypothetical protein PY247_19070 [Acinetobacter proteolyticus]
MKFKLTLAALIIAPIMLTACAKKEEAKNTEQQDQAAAAVSTQTSPEQQAAIDAIDKPNLDENNTDVAEQGAASEVAVSEAQ